MKKSDLIWSMVVLSAATIFAFITAFASPSSSHDVKISKNEKQIENQHNTLLPL